MTLPGRKYSSGKGYRFGFQGQETDDEVNGEDNSIYFKYRVHDPRIGRFASIDPLAPKYPFYSPYHFSSNQPIHAKELEGLESSWDLNSRDPNLNPEARVSFEDVDIDWGEVKRGVGDGLKSLKDWAVNQTKAKTWKRNAKNAVVLALTYIVTDGSPNPQDRIDIIESHGMHMLSVEDIQGMAEWEE